MGSPVAYLLQCHGPPVHLADLLPRLYSPADIFLIHCDAKSNPWLHALAGCFAAALPNVHVLESRLISWGGFSQCEILLRAIGRALALPDDWSHLVVLSEQHLPLHPADVIAQALRPGESLIEARWCGDMGTAEQADIRHRFGMLYRELAGVGPFVCGPVALPDECLDRLHHASSWMVLARNACERLAGLAPGDPSVAPFTRCIQPDEMLVPTLLLGTALGRGLTMSRRNGSFVAYPHVSGTPDLTFTETNFHQARQAGYLFIRKRPDRLPAGVRDALAPPDPKAETVGQAAMASALAEPPDDSVAEMVLVRIRAAVAPLFPTATVRRIDPARVVHAPRIYLAITDSAWSETVSVALLSQDGCHFKAVLIWHRHGCPDPVPVVKGCFTTTICKARVHGIAFEREVILPGETFGGFVTLDGQAGQDNSGLLQALVIRHVAAARAFCQALRSAPDGS